MFTVIRLYFPPKPDGYLDTSFSLRSSIATVTQQTPHNNCLKSAWGAKRVIENAGKSGGKQGKCIGNLESIVEELLVVVCGELSAPE